MPLDLAEFARLEAERTKGPWITMKDPVLITSAWPSPRR